MDTSENKVHFFTIFIFPFKYDCPAGDIAPGRVARKIQNQNAQWKKSRFSVGDLERAKQYELLLNQVLKKDTENQQPDDTESPEQALCNLMSDYNEWQYFHPYVRDMIYETHLSESEELEFLTRTDFTTLCVQSANSNNPPEHISVDVQSIDLHLYNNQIGLLTITTESDGKHTFEQMLRFNDNARRVYPPYLGWYHWKDSEKKDHRDQSSNTSATRKGGCLLPNTITLTGKSSDPVQQVFGDVQLPQSAPFLSKIITELLSPLQPRPWRNNNQSQYDKKALLFESFTDDRMFIISYCANQQLSDKLSRKCCNQFEYESSTDWYKFVFVDGTSPGIANETMKRELIRKHSYARWAEWGTFFGMSRYSFVVLADQKDFSRKVLYHHVKRQYYQLAILVLFQRAMLLKFSQEIKVVSKGFDGESPQFFKKARQLHSNFITFTNSYMFSEVTPQEQGIELYNQWYALLEMDQLFQEVRQEIDDVASYTRNRISHETDQEIAKLTRYVFWLTIGLLVLTTWLVFYGEHELPYLFPKSTTWDSWPDSLKFGAEAILFVFFIVFVLSIVGFILPQRVKNRLPGLTKLKVWWTKR